MTEQEYDDDVAPVLLQLAEKVRGSGGGFVALVDFDGGQGRTILLPEGAGPAIRLAHYGAACKGNADILIAQLIKDGEENGHNSIYLKILERGAKPIGRPVAPANRRLPLNGDPCSPRRTLRRTRNEVNMKLSEEQIAALVEDAKPQVVSALVADLKSAISWDVREMAGKIIREHVEEWIKSEILPELTESLVTSKDGLVAIGIPVAEGVVAAVAESMIAAVKKKLENDWERKDIMTKMFA